MAAFWLFIKIETKIKRTYGTPDAIPKGVIKSITRQRPPMEYATAYFAICREFVVTILIY